MVSDSDSIDDTEQLMSGFAQRLNAHLDRTGYPSRIGERSTRLGKRYDISAKGAEKWIKGKGFPRPSTILEMAADFGTTPGELQYGDTVVGQQTARTADGVVGHVEGGNVLPGPLLGRTVPLIPLSKAGLPMSQYNPFQPGVALGEIPAADSCGPRTYAIRVDGNLMTQADGPSYPHGTLIYCDPDKRDAADIGSRVIATLDNPDETRVFRELDSDSGVRVLRALNAQAGVIREGFTVVAKVVGRYHPED